VNERREKWRRENLKELVEIAIRYPCEMVCVWVEFWSLRTKFENTRFSKIQLEAKTDLDLPVYLL